MNFEVDSLIGKIVDLVSVDHEGEIGDVGSHLSIFRLE